MGSNQSRVCGRQTGPPEPPWVGPSSSQILNRTRVGFLKGTDPECVRTKKCKQLKESLFNQNPKPTELISSELWVRKNEKVLLDSVLVLVLTVFTGRVSAMLKTRGPEPEPSELAVKLPQAKYPD